MTVDLNNKVVRRQAIQREKKRIFNAEDLNAFAGLIRVKHRETHLPNLDRAPDTQRALSAVLIRRRRASLDLEYQNLPEREACILNPSNARLHPMRPALCVLCVLGTLSS